MNAQPVILPGLSGIRAFFFDTLPGTNAFVLENAGRLCDGDVVLTLDQTEGRGRQGRGFISEGKSLCLSVLLKTGPHSLFPLCAGLAVFRALLPYGGVLSLKWPNDVLISDRPSAVDSGCPAAAGKKICGILCEANHADEPFCVIGFGINLFQTAADFEANGLPFAASLFSATGQRVDPLSMAADVVSHFLALSASVVCDPAAMIRDYSSVCATLLQCVNLSDGKTVRAGRALRIENDGSLLVAFPEGSERVYAGDVTILPSIL